MKNLEYQKLLEGTKEVTTNKVVKCDDELRCVHTIVFNNNQIYKWDERNIFDFGTIFNPDFSIMEGKDSGGLVRAIGNRYYFETYGKKNPDDKYQYWYIVRELTEYELKSYLIAEHNSVFRDMFRV